jgi:hypothetical protein
MRPEDRDLAYLWDLRATANHVSEKFQGEHPGIPWRQLVGQRNVPAYEYMGTSKLNASGALQRSIFLKPCPSPFTI